MDTRPWLDLEALMRNHRFLIATIAIESALTLGMAYLTVLMLGIEGYRFLAVLPVAGLCFGAIMVWELVGELIEKLADLEPGGDKKPLDDWHKEWV
jgi:hypothetical protein